MAQLNGISVPMITMQDDLGITYVVENAQQFWSGASGGRASHVSWDS